MTDRNDLIDELRTKVEYLERVDHPQAGAARRAFDDLVDGRRESLKIDVSYKLTLEKFDGEHVAGDGKVPVETIVREGAL